MTTIDLTPAEATATPETGPRGAWKIALTSAFSAAILTAGIAVTVLGGGSNSTPADTVLTPASATTETSTLDPALTTPAETAPAPAAETPAEPVTEPKAENAQVNAPTTAQDDVEPAAEPVKRTRTAERDAADAQVAPTENSAGGVIVDRTRPDTVTDTPAAPVQDSPGQVKPVADPVGTGEVDPDAKGDGPGVDGWDKGGN